MPEDTGWRTHLRSKVREELVKILGEVAWQPEFATEIAEERLDVRRLVRELSTDPRLMDRSVLAYEPVLEAEKAMSSLAGQRPPLRVRGWRPNRRNVGAVVVGLAVPIASAWMMGKFSFFNGTIASLLPLALIGASFAALGFLVRNGLPECVWERLTWEARRLRAWAARKGEQLDWRQAVRDEVVTPYVREWINGAKEPTFDTVLTLRDGSALLSQTRDSPLVQTRSIEAFRRELSRPDPGAVGIAGPRGVGKTTLLERTLDNAFTAADQPPFLTVVASAPARYDPREFILHLYAVTCRAVLRTAGPDERVPAESEDELVWRRLQRRARTVARLQRVCRVAVVSALVWIIAGVITFFALDLVDVSRSVSVARVNAMIDGLISEPFDYLSPWHWDLALQILATLMFGYALGRPVWLIIRYIVDGCWALLFGEWRRRVRRYYSLDHKALCTLARHDLRQVRFLQTRTEGWSGKLSTGGVFEMGLTRTIARAERPLTHPEIVDDYRRLLERVVSVLTPDDISGVIVAIDELDKLADPAEAREFIDEIKGVFGVSRCLFLVSVSEDALTSFQRRGIPIRDAFDSAFTNVIRIDPFTLDDARAWLAKRAFGIPEPFIHLCYCLSGGLPRELRRVAVAMYDLHRDRKDGSDLATIASSLVVADITAKCRAFTSAAVQLDDEADPSAFLAVVTTPACDQASWMISQCTAALPDGPGSPPTGLHRLRWEAASYLYFSATIVEFFTNELPPETMRAAKTNGSITALASARQQMSVDPRVSWELITGFRRQWGLDTVQERPASP
ncbi:hypothetical protein [Amycolatopsis sp. NPDC004169]|uniref:hypothetical protein n=1 Tax=Amycolatopsis sp. NPDC004169 TaxID=3154453 RepID=UPI0033A297DE